MLEEAHRSVVADHFSSRRPWQQTTQVPLGKGATFKEEEALTAMVGVRLAILRAIGGINPSLSRSRSSKTSSSRKWAISLKANSNRAVSNQGIATVPR